MTPEPTPSEAGLDAETRAHFAARAATYASGDDRSLQAMLDLAAPEPGDFLLDVATGTGAVLFALAKRAGPASLAIGVDFTPEMLAQAARRRALLPRPALPGGDTPGRVPVLVAANAARLPFGRERFDVVTCRMGIHHLSDAPAGLAAMAAALRPGGRLVIADFVHPANPAAAAEYDRLEALRGHHYVRVYEQSQLEAMLAAGGCPVTAARTSQRESTPGEWLRGPNVPEESRETLAGLLDQIVQRGEGAGLEVRHTDGQVRLVRTDAILLGIKG